MVNGLQKLIPCTIPGCPLKMRKSRLEKHIASKHKASKLEEDDPLNKQIQRDHARDHNDIPHDHDDISRDHEEILRDHSRDHPIPQTQLEIIKNVIEFEIISTCSKCKDRTRRIKMKKEMKKQQ